MNQSKVESNHFFNNAQVSYSKYNENVICFVAYSSHEFFVLFLFSELLFFVHHQCHRFLQCPFVLYPFFFFISTPFFSAQPGVAYREAVFEPQVCLDLCLTNRKTFVYEITKNSVNYNEIRQCL